jgi:Flp pilus assembly protein TadD
MQTRKPDGGRGVAGEGVAIGDRDRPEHARARFNQAIPVSNRHHDELAR